MLSGQQGSIPRRTDSRRTHSAVPRHRRRSARIGVLSLGASTALLLQITGASASTPAYLGAVGDVADISQAGPPTGTHTYAHLNQTVPTARMITMRTDESWKTVAAAKPGSQIYTDLVRWATTLKSRPGPILFAYHHEPEASGSVRYGSAADYIAAYRHVVLIFRAQGVRNVEYVWQMTAWGFEAPKSDRRYAAKWYPGNDVVDDIGSDAYNWYNCGPRQR